MGTRPVMASKFLVVVAAVLPAVVGLSVVSAIEMAIVVGPIAVPEYDPGIRPLEMVVIPATQTRRRRRAARKKLLPMVQEGQFITRDHVDLGDRFGHSPEAVGHASRP